MLFPSPCPPPEPAGPRSSASPLKPRTLAPPPATETSAARRCPGSFRPVRRMTSRRGFRGLAHALFATPLISETVASNPCSSGIREFRDHPLETSLLQGRRNKLLPPEGRACVVLGLG